MATVEHATQEGLPLTPAMQKLARRETRRRFIGFAALLAFVLIGSVLLLAAILDLSPSTLGFDGVLLFLIIFAMLGLLVAVAGWSAMSARHLACDGTYTRYVGPFSVWHGDSEDDPRHIALYLDGVRASLGQEARLPPGIVDVISMHGGGVVDWLYGIGVLVIWDDRGNCIYRMRHYVEDPDLPPPPVTRRPARTRAWPEG